MSRTFIVTAIEGHVDITQLCDPGPQFAGVMVSASNAAGESVQFYRGLNDQPHVGEAVTFDEIPAGALMEKERP